MLNNQAFTILSLLAGASLVSAHGFVLTWSIDGQEYPGFNPDGQQGYKGAERPTDNTQSNGNGWGPADWRTGQVACGGNSAGSGLESWPMKAGSEVVVQWSGEANGEDPWPPAHVGPILEYMAKCPGTSCDGVAADSLDWFKIGEASYDGGEWPAQKITAGEAWPFTIPSDIAPGAYLVRHEIIALHWAWDPADNRGFEVYPYCFQADVESSGSAVPSDTITFPEAYNPEITRRMSGASTRIPVPRLTFRPVRPSTMEVVPRLLLLRPATPPRPSPRRPPPPRTPSRLRPVATRTLLPPVMTLLPRPRPPPVQAKMTMMRKYPWKSPLPRLWMRWRTRLPLQPLRLLSKHPPSAQVLAAARPQDEPGAREELEDKTTTAAPAQTKASSSDDNEAEEYKRRSVIGRYAARQFVGF